MKKSFSLIETLIATVLLSGTITILLESKNFNLNLISSIKNKTQFDSYISIASVSNIKDDQKIFFDDLLDLEDDELRKKLKEQRLILKKESDNKIDLDLDEFPFSFEITSESYKSDQFGTKKYYRVTINE